MKTLNQQIQGTDIFVFNYHPEPACFTYSRPFTPEEARALAQETNDAINSRYKGANGLRQGLSANEQGELFNMSTLKGIVASRTLMQRTDGQQWLPTIPEGTELQKAGLLPRGILSDFGLALYNERAPDEEIARTLSAKTDTQNHALPVLASFISLDLDLGGERYGVTPILVSADGLVYGNGAETLLEENRFITGNSGVHRVYRDDDGYWLAGWYGDLDGFSGGCRVGRFSAAGSAEKLREEALGKYTQIKKGFDEILSLVA